VDTGQVQNKDMGTITKSMIGREGSLFYHRDRVIGNALNMMGEPLHSGCHHRAFNHFCRGSEFLTVTCRKSDDGMRGVISISSLRASSGSKLADSSGGRALLPLHLLGKLCSGFRCYGYGDHTDRAGLHVSVEGFRNKDPFPIHRWFPAPPWLQAGVVSE